MADLKYYLVTYEINLGGVFTESKFKGLESTVISEDPSELWLRTKEHLRKEDDSIGFSIVHTLPINERVYNFGKQYNRELDAVKRETISLLERDLPRKRGRGISG
ncbi:MAG: hypothetical protein V1663_01760 [archaeon]